MRTASLRAALLLPLAALGAPATTLLPVSLDEPPNTTTAAAVVGAGASAPSFIYGTASTPPPNLIYVKIPKTGSSTGAGIVRRLAAHHGVHGYTIHQHNNIDVASVADLLPFGEPGMWVSHNERRKLDGAIGNLTLPSFIFSTIREPIDRCMSHFYWRARPEAHRAPERRDLMSL